jgi:imidazolonepropionase-like amidohydrolase
MEAKILGPAHLKGVKIAFGTDVGGFAWTENQAKEFVYMVRFGMPAMQTIQSATTVAAGLLDQTADLGSIEPGKYADIVAVANDPLKDISELQHIRFVMKGGDVFRDDLSQK